MVWHTGRKRLEIADIGLLLVNRQGKVFEMSVAYGKLYMKDQNGNIVQIIPDTAAIHGVYQGATAESAGVNGDVPPAQSSERTYYLRGDGQWGDPTELIQPITTAQIQSLYN